MQYQIDPASVGVALLALAWGIYTWISSRARTARVERQQHDAEKRQRDVDNAAQQRQEAVVQALHETNTRLIEAYDRSNELELRLVKAVEKFMSNIRGADHTRLHRAPRSTHVEWIVEHIGKNKWLLRHLQGPVAENVEIDRQSVGGARVEFLPEVPHTLEPGESIEVIAIGIEELPVAHEMRVSWGPEGQRETAIVPLPRWL